MMRCAILAARAISMRPSSLTIAVSSRSCRLCSTATGPDASRGYDVAEYEGLWRNLSRETWPSLQSVAIIGPADNDFVHAVEACSRVVQGCEVLDVTAQPKKRWQSVRVKVRCNSPDDYCELHSRLGSLAGVKALF